MSVKTQQEAISILWTSFARSYTKLFQKYDNPIVSLTKKIKQQEIEGNIFLGEFRLCLYYQVIEDNLKKITLELLAIGK